MRIILSSILLTLALTGCATGALVGAVVGAIGGRVWEEVALDRLRLSFQPQRGGRFALAFSVAS